MSLRLCTDVAATDTDDALVLLDARKGTYWQLNSTGALIVRALLAGAGEGQIAQRLAETRPVSTETAAQDIAELVSQLTEARLVEREAEA